MVWIKGRTGAISCGVSSSILWNGQRYLASGGWRIVLYRCSFTAPAQGELWSWPTKKTNWRRLLQCLPWAALISSWKWSNLMTKMTKLGMTTFNLKYYVVMDDSLYPFICMLRRNLCLIRHWIIGFSLNGPGCKDWIAWSWWKVSLMLMEENCNSFFTTCSA